MHGIMKKNKNNVEITLFNEDEKHSKKRRQNLYNNIITRDPNVIAQILIDLFVLGFPMKKAVKKFNERIEDKKDWMGI